MSKLNVDQKTVKELFENKKSDFLIPDYQRPYAWSEVECLTLWEDIFAFAFPDNDFSKFGFTNSRNQKKEGTKNIELLCLAETTNDFTETNIEKRNQDIINEFIEYLRQNDLLKE